MVISSSVCPERAQSVCDVGSCDGRFPSLLATLLSLVIFTSLILMVVVLGDGGGEVKVDGGREAERARAEPSLFAGCSTLLVGGNTKNVNIQ